MLIMWLQYGFQVVLTTGYCNILSLMCWSIVVVLKMHHQPGGIYSIVPFTFPTYISCLTINIHRIQFQLYNYHYLLYTEFDSTNGTRPLWSISYLTDIDVIKKFNPLGCKFFRGNINICLHFKSFLHTNNIQVVEIPPRVRQGPAYST